MPAAAVPLWHHQMEDEIRAQKKTNICHAISARVLRIVYNTAEFVPNFNSRKISISSWLFFKFFYVSSSGSSSSSLQQSLNPSPQTTKTPTDGRTRTRCRRTDGRSRLVEEAQKTLSWPTERPSYRSTNTALCVLRRKTDFV